MNDIVGKEKRHKIITLFEEEKRNNNGDKFLNQHTSTKTRENMEKDVIV